MKIKQIKDNLGFLILIFVLVFFWYLGRYIPVDPTVLQNALTKFPLLASVFIYILLYVFVTFFVFFSKDLFWLLGALLFGPYLSALLICAAETINAFLLFYLARLLGRRSVEGKLSDKYRHLDEKLGKMGLLWLFVFRAAPLIPYRFLDLSAGLTKIRFRKYLTAVIIGSPIKIFWIQYILYSVGISVFSNPEVLREFFLSHKPLLLFSFIYIIFIIMALLKIRTKE